MILDDLEALLRRRRTDAPAGSYSATLVTAPDRASRKIMEEAYELCHELTRPAVDRGRVTAEAADLLFHVLVGLVSVGVPLEEVLAELADRRAGSTSDDEASVSAAGGATATEDDDTVGDAR
jgi:phosphoribosyl-ATP pyrophosphohydrolase